MVVWLSMLALLGWALRGARCKADRRWVYAVSGLTLSLVLLLEHFLGPYLIARFASTLVAGGIILAVGHHVRRRAMQAVLDGVDRDCLEHSQGSTSQPASPA